MLNQKGQNTAEYAILIALVIAAAVAMQVYVRRGLQGRIVDAVDHPVTQGVGGTVGDKEFQFTTKQYEPYYQDSSADVESSRGYTEDITARGETERTAVSETSTRAAGAYEKSKWEGEAAR